MSNSGGLPSVTERIREVGRLCKRIEKLLCHGPLDYYLRMMVEHSDALLTKYAPFKVGDRAVLAEDIACVGGWKGSEQNLAEGKAGEVIDVGYNDGEFRITFVPDNQTYRCSNGDYKPVTTGYSYCLPASKLRPELEITRKPLES